MKNRFSKKSLKWSLPYDFVDVFRLMKMKMFQCRFPFLVTCQSDALLIV
jgi:hypothetical protein